MPRCYFIAGFLADCVRISAIYERYARLFASGTTFLIVLHHCVELTSYAAIFMIFTISYKDSRILVWVQRSP